jgi:hypothetical protein
MKTSTERAREWRAKHPEEYKERQRALMAKRRGSVAPPVVPVVKAEAVPVVVLSPEPGPAPAVKTPGVSESADAKLFRLLAAGKAAREAELAGPASEPASEPAAESMTRARWKRLSLEARAYHIKHCTELDSDEAVNDWLESLP